MTPQFKHERTVERCHSRSALLRTQPGRPPVESLAYTYSPFVQETLRGNTQARRVVVDGVTHPSINKAAKAIGVPATTLRKAMRKGRRRLNGHSIRGGV